MRIGVTVDGAGRVDDLIAVVAGLARRGLHTAWLPQSPGGEPGPRAGRRHQIFPVDALTAAALAGHCVDGIELGTAVVPVYPRHPMALAMQAATVQDAAGGRFVLGVGSSHPHVVEDMHGLSLARPAAYMREYLSALVPLLSEGKVHVEGQRVVARGAIPRPTEMPTPVLVAALGPQMLQVAGELADGTITWMTGIDVVADHVVPAISRAAAGRAAPRVVVALPVCVTSDADHARAAAERHFLVYRQLPSYRQSLGRGGSEGAGDIAITGDEDQIAVQLARLADAGATDLAATVYGTPEERARTLDALAAIALPELATTTTG